MINGYVYIVTAPANVIGHNISSTVGHNLQATELTLSNDFSITFHLKIFRQGNFPRFLQVIVIRVNHCHVQRSFRIGVFRTVVLVATNRSGKDVVVVNIKCYGVSILTHLGIAVVLQAAVFLDNVLHQVTAIVRFITTVRVNVGNYVQATIYNYNALTVELCTFAISNTFVFRKVLLQIYSQGGHIKDGVASYLGNAYSTFVIGSNVNIIIVACYIVGIYRFTGVTYCTFIPVALCVKSIAVLEVSSAVVILTNV